MRQNLASLHGHFWWRGVGPRFCPRRKSASWKFAPFMYMIFSRQSSICACQNLDGCAVLPRNSPERMHWRCLSHYVSIPWLRRTGFGVYYGQADRQAEPSRLLRIKFEAVDCLLLRMKCKPAISEGFHSFACTISFLLPVFQQKIESDHFLYATFQ